MYLTRALLARLVLVGGFLATGAPLGAQAPSDVCSGHDARSRMLVDSAFLSSRYTDLRDQHGFSGVTAADIRPLVLPADSVACRNLQQVSLADRRRLAAYKAGKFFALATTRPGGIAIHIETLPVLIIDRTLHIIGVITSN